MAGAARVWLALAGLVAGVLCARRVDAFVPVALVTGAACALRRRGPWRAVGIVIVAFGAGAFDASVRSPDRQPAAALAAGVPFCRVSGLTLEDAGGLGTLAALDRAECGGRVAEDAGVVFLDDARGGLAGRRFTAEGWLVPLGDEAFDRARRSAGAAASFSTTTWHDLGFGSPLHAFAGRVRSGLAAAAAPLGPPGGLLRGLTIGDTNGIDPQTEEALRRSGLAHLLAVSGSNVAILLGAVVLGLRRTPFVVRVGSCAVALALFVAVVGPDPSVLRAAAMGAIAIVALVYGRRTEPLHSLGLALVALVALRPGIVYSTGLHLSAAATAGIVLWTRPLAARLERLPKVAAVAVAATVAAQVAVAPLLIAGFGRLPVGGLPANVLAMAAVPPATVLGLGAAALSPVAPGAAGVVARLASPFAAWVLRVGEAFAAPAWASPEVPRAWGLVLAVPVLVATVRSVPTALRPGARNLDVSNRSAPEGG
ncbi:MAG: ComEC/Rec2 family competence protein [Actinomycetota bacterium]|nr:ComEC/Rec2 family competence protein [Actinomycetota bacterium]